MVKKHVSYSVIVSNRIHHLIEPRILPDVAVYWEDDAARKVCRLLPIGPTRRQFFLLFLSIDEVPRVRRLLKRRLRDAGYRIIALALPGERVPQRSDRMSGIADFRNSRISGQEFEFLLEKHLQLFLEETNRNALYEEDMVTLLDTIRDQEALINAGRALSLEQSPEKLLRSLLYLGKKITGADAGIVFLVEEGECGKMLRFKYSHIFSRNVRFQEFSFPADSRSIPGHVALTGRILNIPDVGKLRHDDQIIHDREFDRQSDYRSVSVLAVPMKNHLEEVIGVIQLINCKRSTGRVSSGNEAYRIRLETEDDFVRNVVPFQTRFESLMESVAGQTVTALESRTTIRRIGKQFEEFVRVSVAAVEDRRRSRSGHSSRVADLCVRIACAMNRTLGDSLASVTFGEQELKELSMAGLLHDYGAIRYDSRDPARDGDRDTIRKYPEDLCSLVRRIPWAEEFRNIPEIERVRYDRGGGDTHRPDGRPGSPCVSLQARILAVADVFDTLCMAHRCAGERTVPAGTLNLIRGEMERTGLDGEILDLVFREQLYGTGGPDSARGSSLTESRATTA